jgi:endonuclease/exonuclease/phosphatase (EEP) superfamily protein YafD
MKLLSPLIKLGILGACLGIGLGYLGNIHPFLDTFSHARLHASVGLLVIGLIVLFKKWITFSGLALVVGAIGVYTSLSGTVYSARPLAPHPGKPVYSLLHFNLYWINDQREAVIDRIIELDPDLISISEAATRWEEEIKRLDAKWTYMLHCPEHDDHGGIRFYSKWPLKTDDQYCGPHGSLAKTQVISPEGLEFTSGSVHLRWPWPASGPKQLKAIMPELETIGRDAIFAGDFNAATWSHAVNSFARTSGMKIVKGIGPTFIIDQLPLDYMWWAGLPIDNVMHKGRITILSAKTLEDLGSDHLPVLVRFQIEE